MFLCLIYILLNYFQHVPQFLYVYIIYLNLTNLNFNQLFSQTEEIYSFDFLKKYKKESVFFRDLQIFLIYLIFMK